MAGLLGGLIERCLVVGVGKQDFQYFVLRQPMSGGGEITQHAFHQQPTVVRRPAKSFEELTENRGHALAQLGCRIIGAPEPGLLEQQLEINRLATFLGFEVLPDAFPLVPADCASRLWQPAIKQQRPGFILREGVQIDEVLRRELASLEFGVRLAGRIILGPVGQTGYDQFHMARQRSDRKPVQQPAAVRIGKLVEGVQKQDQRLLRRGGPEMLVQFFCRNALMSVGSSPSRGCRSRSSWQRLPSSERMSDERGVTPMKRTITSGF